MSPAGGVTPVATGIAPPPDLDREAIGGRHRRHAFAADLLYGSPPRAGTSLRAEDPPSVAVQWLLGVASGAVGAFGAASASLRPLVEAEGAGPYRSLAASTLASHRRQLGRHADALALDERALRTAAGDPDAVFDALLGLAADAVGLGDAAAAAHRLGATAPLVPGGPTGWRHRVRRGWVATEIALLTGDPGSAVAAAAAALTDARAVSAPRHVAKCLLFLGASHHVAHRDGTGVTPAPDTLAEPASHGDAADSTLAEAEQHAERVGALPLLWVAAALRADRAELAGDPAAAAVRRSRAADTVRAIAVGLSEDDRDRWLFREDIAAIVQEQGSV